MFSLGDLFDLSAPPSKPAHISQVFSGTVPGTKTSSMVSLQSTDGRSPDRSHTSCDRSAAYWGKSITGSSFNASRMYSPQMGDATAPPAWPIPRERPSLSYPTQMPVVTWGVNPTNHPSFHFFV